jgi:hypothetical protein
LAQLNPPVRKEPAVPATFVRDLISDLRPVRRPARVLYAGAAFWLASALFHTVVLALDGFAWSGAVSFRKPLVFSLSVGLLLAAIGWVLDRLPDRPRLAGALAWTLVVSLTAEVGLIALQAWRGRASHFNQAEPGDVAIFAGMAVLIAVASVCLLAVLVWSVIERPRDRLASVAAIGGLLLVATGLGIGQWIIEAGNDYVEARGGVPGTVVHGDGGVVKFPHGVALHGIQLFILTAVMLRRGTLAEASRRRVMHLVVWSYAAAVAFTATQTMMGQAPLDPSIWNAGLAASLVAVAAGLVRTVTALDLTRRQQPPLLGAS